MPDTPPTEAVEAAARAIASDDGRDFDSASDDDRAEWLDHAEMVLAAAGLVASEEQWSVVYDGGDFDRTNLPGPSDVDGYDTRAEAEEGMPPLRRITITRGVTPWRAADEGGDE